MSLFVQKREAGTCEKCLGDIYRYEGGTWQHADWQDALIGGRHSAWPRPELKEEAR